MTDPNLFALGCVVSFIVLGGFYIHVRTRFTESEAIAESSRPVKASTPIEASHDAA